MFNRETVIYPRGKRSKRERKPRWESKIVYLSKDGDPITIYDTHPTKRSAERHVRLAIYCEVEEGLVETSSDIIYASVRRIPTVTL